MAAPAELLAELLAAVGSGDERAFRRLYDATSAPLLGVLAGMIGRHDLAEEALQDCFIKIWQKAASYNPVRGSAMTWLVTVVRNHAIDMIRTRRQDECGPDPEAELAQWADQGADPCRDAEYAQHMRDLREPLAALAPQVRASLLLTCYAGYTHTESARLMRAPLGTVKSWVRRGLKQVRRHPGAPRFESNAPWTR